MSNRFKNKSESVEIDEHISLERMAGDAGAVHRARHRFRGVRSCGRNLERFRSQTRPNPVYNVIHLRRVRGSDDRGVDHCGRTPNRHDNLSSGERGLAPSSMVGEVYGRTADVARPDRLRFHSGLDHRQQELAPLVRAELDNGSAYLGIHDPPILLLLLHVGGGPKLSRSIGARGSARIRSANRRNFALSVSRYDRFIIICTSVPHLRVLFNLVYRRLVVFVRSCARRQDNFVM